MEVKFMTEPPLDTSLMMCPACGEEKRIWIHSQKEQRLRCGTCNRTFAEIHGSPWFRLQYPQWLVIVELSLLAHGCPVQAIGFALGLDERTVSEWHERAGRHAQRVQERVVCQGQIETTQIQADERCVKMQRGTVWIATAVCVFSRLFIWGEVDAQRNTGLVQRVVERVWMALKRSGPLLWVTDGFGAWAKAVAKTAYVERLNASLRTWLPALTRRSRTPARCQDRLRTALFWTGCVYNFCQIHASLQGTPAMAANTTSDVWSVRELLLCFSVRPKSLHAVS